MTRFFPLPAFCMFAIFLVPSATFAETSPDRFQMNHDIHIQADEKVGDVTCIGSSSGRYPATSQLSPEV